MKIIKVKKGQTVHIDNTVFITVKSVNYNTVRLGFTASPSVTIALIKEGQNKNDHNK